MFEALFNNNQKVRQAGGPPGCGTRALASTARYPSRCYNYSLRKFYSGRAKCAGAVRCRDRSAALDLFIRLRVTHL
ncbi:hypothetical protein EVAR_11728_1 [Eumeta japonica]|uniref:Uncharacterized protein n=1 Tax=Eumeta variegata TaxID=151549 RepID=A0A4C1UPL5_EUMVA|nr:hypothetical protein EVAR_11728_1 [Eumeta japonica]